MGAAAMGLTVADWEALPPAPVHVSVYVALAEIGPVLYEPLTGSAPDQASEAVHAVALVEDQVSVALPPLATALEFELIETVGAAFAALLTVTVAD